MEQERNKAPKSGDQPTPRKKRRKKKASVSFTITYLLGILCISIILSGLAIVWGNDVLALVKEDKVIEIVIPENATTGQLSKLLDQNGVIEYGSIFQMFIGLTSKDPVYVAGKHELNSKMDYRAIISRVKRNEGAKSTVSITVPEGFTLEQIIDLLAEKKVSTKEKLWETASTYPYKHSFLAERPIEKKRLEGYLFPDTYQFYENDNTVMVFNKMLNNFSDKVDSEILDKAKSLGYSVHELVTLAALIEREAKLETDQTKISGVIHNRLASKKYPFLEIDASILYAVGHKNALTKEDLAIDSPYNTYKYKGLPPGPIANPGYGAISAAAFPEKHSYYFYVAKPDGSHIFSKNLDEHNAAIAAIKKEAK